MQADISSRLLTEVPPPTNFLFRQFHLLRLYAKLRYATALGRLLKKQSQFRLTLFL